MYRLLIKTLLLSMNCFRITAWNNCKTSKILKKVLKLKNNLEETTKTTKTNFEENAKLPNPNLEENCIP